MTNKQPDLSESMLEDSTGGCEDPALRDGSRHDSRLANGDQPDPSGRVPPRGSSTRQAEETILSDKTEESFDDVVRTELKRLVTVYVGGKRQRVTVARAVFQEVICSALRGDRPAQKLLFDVMTKLDSSPSVDKPRVFDFSRLSDE